MLSDPYRFIDAFVCGNHSRGDEPVFDPASDPMPDSDEVVLLRSLGWTGLAAGLARHQEDTAIDLMMALLPIVELARKSRPDLDDLAA